MFHWDKIHKLHCPCGLVITLILVTTPRNNIMGTIISSRPMSVIYWKCFQPLHGACSGLQSQQDIEMNKYECITVLSLLLLFHCILPLLAGVFTHCSPDGSLSLQASNHNILLLVSIQSRTIF